LDVQSTLGSGSRFICHFPLSRVQLARESQPETV
jgi:hypothetical protein